MPGLQPIRPYRRTVLAAALAGGAGLAVGFAAAQVAYSPLEVLLQTDRTVIGQPIAYPSGAPQVTAAIVTLAPGEATGRHRHDAPLFAYMLAGELTVDYGPDGTKVYRAGDALLEALKTGHEGTSTGAEAARVLAVFIGADGVANSVAEAE